MPPLILLTWQPDFMNTLERHSSTSTDLSIPHPQGGPRGPGAFEKGILGLGSFLYKNVDIDKNLDF